MPKTYPYHLAPPVRMLGDCKDVPLTRFVSTYATPKIDKKNSKQ